MIRCTPVWGPEPVRKLVSGLPSGRRIVNETLVGRPGRTAPPGWKSASENTRAGATRGMLTAPELEEPQPPTPAAASTPAPARHIEARRTKVRLASAPQRPRCLRVNILLSGLAGAAFGRGR